MIARPPEKNFSSKTTVFSPLFMKTANDNRPPKRSLFGWLVFLSGLLLLIGAASWIYERMI